MKKIMFALAAVAMMAGCAQDLTNDITVDGPQNEQNINFYGGIVVEASMNDVTRVTVDADTSAATSTLAWEAGDKITISYNGGNYIYVAQTSGVTSTFAPQDADNAILSIDSSLDVAAYYNVTSVDAASKVASFAIQSNQTEGALSNKLPLYAYNASAQYADGKLVLTMNPLASVVEFEVRSSGDWRATALSLTPSSSALAEGYTTVSGAKINPATGEIDTTEATTSLGAVVVNFAEKNFNGSKNVQLVVGAVKYSGATAGDSAVTLGGAAVRLLNNGVENFCRTIWASEANFVDFTATRKHLYQPIADILAGHCNGISTADDLKALADAVNSSKENYPVGTGFCNDEGVILLNNDIDLSAFDNWTPIGSVAVSRSRFAGVFDGQGNTVSGMKCNLTVETYPISYIDVETGAVATKAGTGAGLFGIVAGAGEIRNLTVKGDMTLNYADDDINWSYAGGIAAQMLGATIKNCTNEVNITLGVDASGKSRIGGIVGRASAQAGSSVVSDCTNKGVITATEGEGRSSVYTYIGGCIGFIGDDTAGNSYHISNLYNRADITTTVTTGAKSCAGGVIGLITKNNGDDGLFENLHNYGKLTVACPWIGGITGKISGHTLRDCVNEEGADFTINTPATADALKDCEICTGGIAGRCESEDKTCEKVARIEDCINYGNISIPSTVTIKSAFSGGIAGGLYFTSELSGSVNYGNIDIDRLSVTAHSGGVCGKVGVSGTGVYGGRNGVQISECRNYGTISTKTNYNIGWNYLGGITGSLYGGTNLADSENYGVCITDCTNYGVCRIESGDGKNRMGGISGILNSSEMYNCTNAGVVAINRNSLGKYTDNGSTKTYTEPTGGIVGFVEAYKGVIYGCKNEGTVCCTTNDNNIKNPLGGIMGAGGNNLLRIDSCITVGDVLCSDTSSADKAGAVFGNTSNKGIVLCKSKIGGRIGVVDEGFTANESKTYALTNESGDTYYWEKWICSPLVTTKTPSCSNNSFGN